MSFSEVIETAQSIALLSRLQPTDEHIWYKYCRIYSKKFSEPLSKVLEMDPEFVVTQIFSDQFDELKLDEQEHLDYIQDILGSLSDPEYDAKKEQAERDSFRKLEEEEKLRVQEGRSVHYSMDKEKLKFVKEDKPLKELPKSGGLNMDVLRRLQNEESESGEF